MGSAGWEELAKDYEEETGVDVEVQLVPWGSGS
jgi:ABC-type glycerol-3-phosphate transport system substrate-binding protein